MTRLVLALYLLILCACSGSSELSKEERAKVDPALMKLFSGSVVDEGEYSVVVRPDGVKEYEVILRVTTAEELKSTGIKMQTVSGSIVTARVTLNELRMILKLESVRSVQNGSRNNPN